MFKSKSYLSMLAGILFLLTFLMTGCAKDEFTGPLSEDETFKSMQSFDAHYDSDGLRFGEDDPTDNGDITDDEDDEDDTDRTSNK